MSLKARVSRYVEALRHNKVVAFDSETTLIPKDPKWSLWGDTPRYVLGLYRRLDMPSATETDSFRWPTSEGAFRKQAAEYAEGDWIFAAHNVEYDLAVAFPQWDRWHSKNVMTWDTMFADYLLNGQQRLPRDLNSVAARCGLTLQKDDEVSALIKAGTCPSEMDREMLARYLLTDVRLTAMIFKKQLIDLKQRTPQFQHLFYTQMLWRTTTIGMSARGMRVDTAKAEAAAAEFQTIIDSTDLTIRGALYTEAVLPDEIRLEMEAWQGLQNHLKSNSVQQLKALIYGGSFPFTWKRPTGETFKTGAKAGQPKYKNHQDTVTYPGMFVHHGEASTDDAALSKLLSHGRINGTRKYAGDINPNEILQAIQKNREFGKLVSTYLIGYVGYAKYDGRLHPKYSHTTTPTGRLACSSPNCQNLTKK